MRADTVAAMENNDSPCRCKSAGQVKFGRRIAERWPDLGRVKELRSGRTCRQTEQHEESQGTPGFHNRQSFRGFPRHASRDKLQRKIPNQLPEGIVQR